mgnify:CR=1 FL=1
MHGELLEAAELAAAHALGHIYEHGGQGVIGVAAIGAGDPQLERLVLGEPPIVGNALVASVGRLGGR